MEEICLSYAKEIEIMKNTYTFVNTQTTKEQLIKFTKELEKIIAVAFERQSSIDNTADKIPEKV